MILVFVLYALFASVFIFGKFGLEYTQPLFLVGSRMLFAGVLMLGYEIGVKKRALSFGKSTWMRLLLLALFNIYLTNALEFWGLQFLTSAKTCFIYSLSPFLAALFSYLIFSEVLSLKKWIGLLVGFLGFIPVLLHQTLEEELAGSFFYFSWPELALMGAAASSVFGWIILKQIVNENGLTPLTANGVSMFVGGVIALSHSFISEEWNPIPVTNYTAYLVATVTLICVSNFICYNLYGHLLKKFSATFMSFAGFSTPIFCSLFGWLFLYEVPNWQLGLSMVIVFSGLCLFYQEELLSTVPVKES